MFKADQYSASEKYLPDGMVVVAPSGALGSTWYGTTPEEADLLSGQSGASVSIVNTGVAITTELTVHPVNANVYASEIVLPSFERMDAVYCIKAY
nr:MAG TPA: Major capsid protein [Caudoviricetes sp.]